MGVWMGRMQPHQLSFHDFIIMLLFSLLFFVSDNSPPGETVTARSFSRTRCPVYGVPFLRSRFLPKEFITEKPNLHFYFGLVHLYNGIIRNSKKRCRVPQSVFLKILSHTKLSDQMYQLKFLYI